jgi:hypothetical protein
MQLVLKRRSTERSTHQENVLGLNCIDITKRIYFHAYVKQNEDKNWIHFKE